MPVIASEVKLVRNLGSGPGSVGVAGEEEVKEPGKDFTAALCYERLNAEFVPLLGQPHAAEVRLQLLRPPQGITVVVLCFLSWILV